MRAHILTVTALAGYAAAAACPFQALKRSGALSDEDLAKFEAVKRDPKLAEELFAAHSSGDAVAKDAKSKRSPDSISDLLGGVTSGLEEGLSDITNLTAGVLTLGGGLDGLLQPLTGILADLDLPTPQTQGLLEIPGDDPDHQFQQPGPNDQRGICPTLNTLANHGYISRDGITTFAEAANAVQIGYGFGFGLSVALSALGLLAGGDLVTGKYSIGGADDRVPNTLGPALGLDKHGVFEIDNSITRVDNYFGNQANFTQYRWDQLVNITEQYDGQFGRETFIDEKALHYDESVATNPEFFAGPKWLIVAHAERAFVYRGLPNGTDQGNANYANIAPFFLNETFPPDWYRRDSPYSLTGFVTDVLDLFLGSARPLGGNEDAVNNFVPLDIDIGSDTTVEELGCFVLENILDVVPGQVAPVIVDNIDVVGGFLNGVVAPFFQDSFNCNLKSYIAPSANSTTDAVGSLPNDGPVIINGVYSS